MKTHLRVLTLAALMGVALTGCSPEPEKTEEAPVIRPVKTMVIGLDNQSMIREFPARVLASDRAEMAFRVAGKVDSLPAKEGDDVKKGTVLATLDDTRFKLAVRDARATLQRLQADYKRAQELIKDSFISKKDFEQIRADLTRAQASYDNARTQLSYTKLVAPFDGFVAQRSIQNFENVEAKQVVFSFQNLNTLELKFAVPEKLVRQIRDEQAAEPVEIPVFAYFDVAREKPYPVVITEVSSKADSDTQTFEVTVTLEAPTDQNILPGMTGYVTADFSNLNQTKGAVQIPTTAVVSDNSHNPTVWVVGDDNTVSPKSIEVSTMAGERITVLSGLEMGERIVTVGVPFLNEGMEVSLMPEIDQAQ
ncbi:efflux RND transporter periplasmic adaptor subunit [Vibrio sp. 10N.286.49.B1]|uniref:efflux RND transporter periplasmic adaptor subunit n=1 Tax=unclassified Vibrio TaxID=2614977 RepID=UPI000C855B3A|nr:MULTISPECIES: efflux RND transporter periplasmic adaptor subunit [unclassified Vibrio]